MTTFNERFAKLLKAKDIRPARVAKIMGVSRQVVDNYLGKTLPGFAHLAKIIEAFPNVNLRWLILGEGYNENDISELNEMYPEEIKNTDLKILLMLLKDERKEVERLRTQNHKFMKIIMEYAENRTE